MQTIIAKDVMWEVSGQYMTAVNDLIEEKTPETIVKEITTYWKLYSKNLLHNELIATYSELNKKTEKVTHLYEMLVACQGAYSAIKKFGTRAEADAAFVKVTEARKKHEAERYALKCTVRRIEKLTRELEA